MKNELKCIAIDDEPMALLVIEQFCRRRGMIELTCFSEPHVGLEEIRRSKPDIVFLDIQMNSINGLEIAGMLSGTCSFIFTTAYAEYALEGFNLDAVDFLHKPFSYERFCTAIEKAVRRIGSSRNSQPAQQLQPSPSSQTAQTGQTSHTKDTLQTTLHEQQLQQREQLQQKGQLEQREQLEQKGAREQLMQPLQPEFLIVKQEYNNISIPLADIAYIEALGNYVKIIRISEKHVLTRNNMKSIMALLPKGRFIRVHRSYAIPTANVTSFTHTHIKVKGTARDIPIGAIYADEVMRYFEKGN